MTSTKYDHLHHYAVQKCCHCLGRFVRVLDWESARESVPKGVQSSWAESNMTYSITIGGDRRLAIPSLHFWRSVRIPWQKFQTHKIHKLHTPLQSGPGRALGLGLLEAFSEVPKCAKCRSNMVQRQLISKALPLCRWLVAWFAAGLWIMKSSLCRNASIDHATRCLDIYL